MQPACVSGRTALGRQIVPSSTLGQPEVPAVGCA